MKRNTLFCLVAVLAMAVHGLRAQNPVAVLETDIAPINGTNEVETLTFGSGITGGTFTLKYGNSTTKAIAWSATNNTLRDNIDAALEKLQTVGTGGAVTAVGTMTAGIGTITVTFGGKNAHLDVVQMTVPTNALTGDTHTLAVSTTTPGVTGDGRLYGPGTLDYDKGGQAFYVNNGTLYNPNWAAALP